jgi:hypothetical protein
LASGDRGPTFSTAFVNQLGRIVFTELGLGYDHSGERGDFVAFYFISFLRLLQLFASAYPSDLSD